MTALIVFFCQELVGLIVFFLINKNLGTEDIKTKPLASAPKGMLERLVLFTGLLHGYPQIIIAFAAIKLGTRLHGEQKKQISNTYFLTGNLISLLLAMIGSIIVKAIWQL